ncbi:hypothetical protein SEVIR_9G314900v4 [Setaria viridis]|uniref:Uncharacterized protein n=1 Tax=Setaria italica TaxID=4555 RepID=K4AGZ8_SETIT
MSSPARSTVSAASGGAVSAAEDVADSIDALYRKDEAVAELKSEVMEALQREVRSLDDDSWMFAAPRSRINLVSRPGKNRKVLTCRSNKGNSWNWVKHLRKQGTSRA